MEQLTMDFEQMSAVASTLGRQIWHQWLGRTRKNLQQEFWNEEVRELTSLQVTRKPQRIR